MGDAPVSNRSTDLPAGVMDFKTFDISGLASEQHTTPTGMREDVVLLSWLIVLLRTREDSRVSFDWTYQSASEQKAEKRCLSMDNVMTGLQDRVGKVAAAIFDDVETVAPSHHVPATSSPASLLLSTGSLSQTSEEPKDEGVLHLEVVLGDGLLGVRPVWHTENMLQFTVERHVDVLVETMRLCISNPDASIEDCLRPTARDLDDIWGWNHELPPTYDFCMHDMIAERAQAVPDKVAISSWDGSLTYAQIDRYSTRTACSLKEAGVQLHDVVPACFEKSRWTIVAVLAIMKAGATFALMDPTLPLARLQNMAIQVGAKTMLSSRMQHELSTSILPSGTHIVVEEDSFARLSPSDAPPTLDPVPASALMYIIFTSGSTGTPKGVTISHRTYTSSAIPRAKAVGYAADWRVLDFASYAFDVSIDSMLLTTGNGGCLCIPSDEDRLNDINGAMRAMRVNYAGITPSVARILEPDVIASLHGLGLGGEAASARDVALWGRETRIIIGYGPCECTIGCTVNADTATGRDYISIGTGNGAAIWIADPNDHEALVPVGAVGELLVEGPIVGQGYLNDAEKTAAAFIEDPSWLVAGHEGYAGRGGRLYKTGDLGRYDPDGSGGIVFAGRKDTQVKLRGQRVELGEIESQLRARLPSDTNVIAEVIVPQGTGGQPTLVAFVASQGYADGELSSTTLAGEMRELLSKADAELATVVPRYMVPNAYIPVSHIPVLISGKTDRKRLRAFGQTVDLRQLDHGGATSSSTSRELNDVEKRLQQAWGQVLSVDADGIRPDDNLFALGGDSLAAMRLVSVCRDAGLDLSVIAIFANPTLAAMAQVARVVNAQARTELAPFSMISQDVESARLEAAAACGTDAAAVEDIYPSTPTQQSLFTFAIKSTKAYVAQRVARIPGHIPLDAWKKAWEDVVAANPILRTRLAQLQDPGFQQVVLKENIAWRHATHLASYLESDRQDAMQLGQPLARYAIVTPDDDDDDDNNNNNNTSRYMVWTIHHVLYDGWSEPLILNQVRNALQQPNQAAAATTTTTPAQMRDFVNWIRHQNDTATQDFWRRQLHDAVGPQFPRLPSRDYQPTPTATVSLAMTTTSSSNSGSASASASSRTFTTATLLRGAWALVAAQHAATDDVVFGETLTGRDVEGLAGVEGVVGPLIATVPVRIRVGVGATTTSTVESYLRAVRRGVLERTPHQHVGFQNIRRVSPDAQRACETGTGLVFQPEGEGDGGCVGELGFEVGDVVQEALHFNAYPVMLAFGIRKGGGVRVCASFDEGLVSVAQMRRVLAQLDVAYARLMAAPLDAPLGDVAAGLLPGDELDAVWRWNGTPPMGVDESLRCLRADGASVRPGEVYPRAVVPWVCDLRSPAKALAPIGCVGELWLEGAVLPGETVENPAWLVAGSPGCAGREGRVQPTGDLVRLLEDGSIVFVRRKDKVLRIQGHAVDVADFDAPFKACLPQTVRAAVAVSQQESGDDDERVLVVLVEHPDSEESGVELRPTTHDVTCEGEGLQVCSSAPATLVVALKKLDKFIQDSLASYMVPFAYVVVDKLPTEINHKALNQLASAVPRDVLTQLRQGLQEAWTKSAPQSTLSPAEDVLRSSWAELLGIAPDQIEVDDNFFRLGGDSVSAMKLASSLRAQGHSLSVADIFLHMRLGDAAKVMKMNHALSSSTTAKSQPPYKPFSVLGKVDVDAFLSDVVRPQLADSRWSVQDVYPVTDSQALDVKATIQAPRTSVQYTLLYLDSSVDSEQLSRACTQLVKTHDILRTVFVRDAESNRFLQVVLHNLDAPIATQHQADGVNLEQHVTDLCKADIESASISLGSPFLKLFHVHGSGEDDNGRSCLIIRLSHAQYDGVSLPRLLEDLDTLCKGAAAGPLPPFEPYSTYIARVVHNDRSPHHRAALHHWRRLLADSTPTPFPEGRSTTTTPHPTDRALFLSAPIAHSPTTTTNSETTTASLLTAAWALVLARRSQCTDVVFGAITSGRAVDVGDDAGADADAMLPTNVADVVGPCYQFTPVRVRFAAGWTARELLGSVQRQAAGAAGRDFVGVGRIARECGWSGTGGEDCGKELGPGLFGSVVHCQDAAEDFDEMPFAGGRCRVGVEKPHGDAAWPFKAVSFVKGGVVHVGVVGSERDGAFVEEMLGELVGAVGELAAPPVEGTALLGGEVFEGAA
ncbi:nonribosomal peptide synthase [Diplodia corticola]|uniref:Nonribosomal peptide synthase n=1 Tax=Diplodia corticola TaxID=236234 RepID=A0A1J9RJR3_9PEZI|nr:nonribosomal peptide synthase [Diplodia corticola]OJD28775.1 nonribosomal peptide synthase [Diplodia corticola]